MRTLLAVMVKDDADRLGHCIYSAQDMVNDVLVLDTGSTDDTIEVARRLGATVIESEWLGWAETRNLLLVRARELAVDRILLLDSDMTIEGELPADEDVDCWRAPLLYDGIEYFRPFLVSARTPFEYRGVTHEALYCDEPFRAADTNAFTVTHHGGKRASLEQDKELLEASGAADTRNLFYLAQTYRDLGDYQSAIGCYLARAELGGYDEERWHALYQAGCLLCAHRSYAEGAKVLLRAWELRPGRAEPLRALATSSMNVADKIPYPDGDHLFIEPDAYA